jgi:hypothetical protein
MYSYDGVAKNIIELFRWLITIMVGSGVHLIWYEVLQSTLRTHTHSLLALPVHHYTPTSSCTDT